MKRTLCLALILSLTAPAAFGQGMGSFGSGERLKTNQMVFLAGEGDAPEIAALTAAVRSELERSRQIEPVYVDDDSKAKLAVPTGLGKDATGENLTVKFQLMTAQRRVTEQQVTCAATKLNACAREIVTHAEKFARDNRNR